jgi:hypothetical protein
VGDPVFEREEERKRLIDRIYSTMETQGLGAYKGRVGVRIYRFGECSIMIVDRMSVVTLHFIPCLTMK